MAVGMLGRWLVAGGASAEPQAKEVPLFCWPAALLQALPTALRLARLALAQLLAGHTGWPHWPL